jgi:hypothetical protein
VTDALHQRIAELRTLPAGWLDGAGLPPSESALQRAEQVAREAIARGCPGYPHAYPTERGGVQLEWDAATGTADVEFDAGSVCAVFMAKHGPDSDTEDEAGLVPWLVARLRDLPPPTPESTCLSR